MNINIEKYPFFANWIDSVPEGWKVLIPCLLEDLEMACIADNTDINDIKISDVKEKYGELRIYATCSDTCQKILDIYQFISSMFCINCGHPHIAMTKGWIAPFCNDCWKESWGEWVEETQDFNYRYTTYDGNETKEIVVDTKPYYERVLKYVD